MQRVILFLLLLSVCFGAKAQRFFNLTTEQVQVDSVLPEFTYILPLEGAFQDSLYTAEILYPEFIDMTSSDVRNYQKLSKAPLPSLPIPKLEVGLDRRKPQLQVSLSPLVYRNGKYQILVSFMLRIDAHRFAYPIQRAPISPNPGADRYAAHSVLRSGKWVKIRVPQSGFYELTNSLIRQAGFTDLNKVKVYGYGGALQNEQLVGAELSQLDDLKQVPRTIVNGKHVFYAQGTVSWADEKTPMRTRNPYSDYGYYFLTENNDSLLLQSPNDFMQNHYPLADDYHFLVENDAFSWYPGGRKLFDGQPISVGQVRSIAIPHPAGATQANIYINVSAGVESKVDILLNDTKLTTLNIRLSTYDKGNEASYTGVMPQLQDNDVLKIVPVSGGPVRLDYVGVAFDKPKPPVNLATATLPIPELVHRITNQDLHADTAVDMVIIIPTSQKVRVQAERLKAFHERHFGRRVRIVPADELYNEFSSGTPDANAYRRYLKMLYDRATTDADAPKYLLLFGDCVWDNRMLTPKTRNFNPDDYLLAFESENSFNEIYCYVDDGFFCLLDDGEGLNPQSRDLLDMAVGRFPVTTEEEAKIMVDKTINYAENANGGDWANTIMFMADDGNNNLHMNDVNAAADQVAGRYPHYLIKKVMWDAYKRVSTSIGFRYPDATNAIKLQQNRGALIMDYGGHGVEYQISHENVLNLEDFSTFSNTNLPLWITASCDIMPFDGVVKTIGEEAVLNPRGGAVAFYGTTRTVYANYNKMLNIAFLKHVLSYTDEGKPITIGEAQRRAKNEMITERGGDKTTNKLQYSLLGDPALPLNLPQYIVVVDSIDGVRIAGDTQPILKAGAKVTFSGHIAKPAAVTTATATLVATDEPAGDFSGTVSVTLRDNLERITCLNQESTSTTAFSFWDRPKTLVQRSDSVRNGFFSLSFTMPMDINYSDLPGIINLYAVGNDRRKIAHGSSDRFLIGGSASNLTDSIGPEVYCYLNTPDFTDGGTVNTTPYFVAEVSDSSGINPGLGIGHDMMLVIDGKHSLSYNLNEYFRYRLGSSSTGRVEFSIPALEPGKHSLMFRVWDQMGNQTTRTLRFKVEKGDMPNILSVSATENPARNLTSFIVNHDRAGSQCGIIIEVFDSGGRKLWEKEEREVGSGSTYSYTWDLTDSQGHKLRTGVYLYRVSMYSDGSMLSSKTRKLIVMNDNK